MVIARALTQQANILLLDEAASGLDIARKIEIYDLLRKKNGHGATIITAIHDLNLAALYCPRLVFLKQGRVVLDGPAKEVFTEENLKEVYETDIKVTPPPGYRGSPGSPGAWCCWPWCCGPLTRGPRFPSKTIPARRLPWSNRPGGS